MRITFPLIINRFGGASRPTYIVTIILGLGTSRPSPIPTSFVIVTILMIWYVTSKSHPNEFCHRDNPYEYESTDMADSISIMGVVWR